jgi:S1-C subfamily serine protease
VALNKFRHYEPLRSVVGVSVRYPSDTVRAYPLVRAGVSAAEVRLAAAVLWLLAVIGVLIAGFGPAAAADTVRSPFVAVGRTVRPAVVNIRTIRSVTQGGVDTSPLQEMFRQFFGDEEGGSGNRFENPGTGSGFVVNVSGDILTNHHVIAGADAIFVRFSGERREYRAELVGSDPNTDLALIRIDPGARALPQLRFADSDAVEVGDWAIAVGNPFGHLEGSLTVGVVSAKGRGDLVIAGQTPRYQDFIQTDASINFGNSGGPLVDVNGLVIGVNTAINAAGQGIGFAVPSNLVRRIYEQLRDKGRVVRGYLGVRTRDVLTVVGEEQAGRPQAGAEVLHVEENSPASRAGVQVSDVIVRLDGHEVLDRRQLQFLVADAPLAEAIECEVVRGSVDLTLTVELTDLAELPQQLADEISFWLGMEVASVASGAKRVKRLKEALGVDATSGVIVVAIDEDQPAAEAGIRPGDVLVAIDGQEIGDLAGYERLRQQFAARREPLSFLIRTGPVENYVLVEPRDLGVRQ